MKIRCCNCGFVVEKSDIMREDIACKKCGSNASEALVPHSRSKSESTEPGGRLLMEIPSGRDNLME